MRGKAADVQRKPLKDLRKIWRSIAQDHFLKNYKKVLKPTVNVLRSIYVSSSFDLTSALNQLHPDYDFAL